MTMGVARPNWSPDGVAFDRSSSSSSSSFGRRRPSQPWTSAEDEGGLSCNVVLLGAGVPTGTTRGHTGPAILPDGRVFTSSTQNPTLWQLDPSTNFTTAISTCSLTLTTGSTVFGASGLDYNPEDGLVYILYDINFPEREVGILDVDTCVITPTCIANTQDLRFAAFEIDDLGRFWFQTGFGGAVSERLFTVGAAPCNASIVPICECGQPCATATEVPTMAPTTLSPTASPTTAVPTTEPTMEPTPSPTPSPTTAVPTMAPTMAPTPSPTEAPTFTLPPVPTPAPTPNHISNWWGFGSVAFAFVLLVIVVATRLGT